MDLRVEKTKRSIINAFLQLRSRKPLEKIKVKELTELANINKATFYLHYSDIYHLSEFLERETVQSVIKGIEHPKYIFSENRTFIKELTNAFVANEQLIKILFEGTRSNSFLSIFEQEFTAMIKKTNPNYKQNVRNSMMFTYLVYGGYYTYFKYCDYGMEAVLKIIERFSDGIVNSLKDDGTGD